MTRNGVPAPTASCSSNQHTRCSGAWQVSESIAAMLPDLEPGSGPCSCWCHVQPEDEAWLPESVPWAVADGKGDLLRCLRCGSTQEVELPMDLSAYVAVLREWARRHADCQESS